MNLKAMLNLNTTSKNFKCIEGGVIASGKRLCERCIVIFDLVCY